MALQMRRGKERDFDETQMVPGEWAISTDTQFIRMCFERGKAIKIPTETAIMIIQDLCKEYSDSAYDSLLKTIEYEAKAKDSRLDAEAWAVGQRDGQDVPPTDITFENNSKYYSEMSGTYWQRIKDAIDMVVPEVYIDFETGTLNYRGSTLIFSINDNGFLCWEVIYG